MNGKGIKKIMNKYKISRNEYRILVASEISNRSIWSKSPSPKVFKELQKTDSNEMAKIRSKSMYIIYFLI